MKSIYDIQQLLKRFGTIIYVGDRIADLELMENDLRELFQANFIEPKEYQTAILLLRHERQLLLDRQRQGKSVFDL